MPRGFRLAVVVFVLGGMASACGSPPPPTTRATALRALGSWQGRGSQTIGVVSESGRLRVSWTTRDERPGGEGTFRLTAHSAVSGRQIQVLADHRGAGAGTARVDDDPRPYNLMVESANVQWTVAVEEEVVVDQRSPTGAGPGR
ncbi:MAG: hypothetical protein ACT4QD_00040 [Acidobacteriota bacterium]